VTAALLEPWFPGFDFARVRLVTGGPGSWFVRSVLRQGAMTFAPFVFFGRDRFDPASASSLALLAHELKHIEQYRRYGHVRFLLRYLRDKARNGFKYSRDLPLEVEPYALQAEVRQALRARLP
jgi:hypothetical protein